MYDPKLHQLQTEQFKELGKQSVATNKCILLIYGPPKQKYTFISDHTLNYSGVINGYIKGYRFRLKFNTYTSELDPDPMVI